ncbi:MAG: hypothetical protein AB7N76_00450 [Planctomycetota bacterium]
MHPDGEDRRALAALLREPLEVCSEAALALALVAPSGVSSASEELVAALPVVPPEARGAVCDAILTLTRRGARLDSEELALVAPLLADADPLARLGAVRCLAGVTDPALREQVERLRDDPDASVRRAARGVTDRWLDED